MALLPYGTKSASGTVTLAGMSQLIYQEMDELLSPLLQKAVDDAQPEAKEVAQKALDEACLGWQKLAYAVASGVVEHVLGNLEIRGIQTQGDVDVTINGSTASTNAHQHGAGTLAGTQNNVTFSQINEGTGFIE